MEKTHNLTNTLKQNQNFDSIAVGTSVLINLIICIRLDLSTPLLIRISYM